MEDADLLKDEVGGSEHVAHRLMQQPSVIKHGIMREYQMQGLNWLIHLYDNGINGILADEMVGTPSVATPRRDVLGRVFKLRVAALEFPQGHACKPVVMAAGAGQDAADNLAAGVPARVSRHPRAPHGHRAQVHAAQLDQRVPQVVSIHPRCQIPRQPG